MENARLKKTAHDHGSQIPTMLCGVHVSGGDRLSRFGYQEEGCGDKSAIGTFAELLRELVTLERTVPAQ